MPKYYNRVTLEYPVAATNPKDSLSTLDMALKVTTGMDIDGKVEVVDEAGKVVLIAKYLHPLTDREINVRRNTVFDLAKKEFAGKKLYRYQLMDIVHPLMGLVADTGGGTLVGVIPLDLRHCIGVTDESVVVYRTDEPHTDMMEIFWEGVQMWVRNFAEEDHT